MTAGTEYNLIFYSDDSKELKRHLYWDEENRLEGVFDENWGSAYQYDATGERVYKLTGERLNLLINGRWGFAYSLGEGTLYASAYLVATPKGYTKHYYAENERLASKIGGGMLAGILTPVVEETVCADKKTVLRNGLEGRYKEQVLNVQDNGLQILYDMETKVVPETEGYWYHSDHLGSSSWITNTSGAAVQHLQYLPFGESFIDQRSDSELGSRYTFSAKEKDEETGYGYFGARYYSSDLSIWLGVDPMAEKYPSLSPYVYCANNPLILIDPNGMEVIITGDASGTAVKDLQNNLENIKIERNEKTGKLSVSGKPQTDAEKQIYNAITDDKVRVHVTAENTDKISGEFGTNGGSFLGTVLKTETDANGKSSTTVDSYQFVNPTMLSNLDKKELSKEGTNMKHEITESYQAGLLSLSKNKAAGAPIGKANRAIYDKAHSRATPQSWATDQKMQLNNIIQNAKKKIGW